MGSKKFRQLFLLIGTIWLCLGFKIYSGTKGWKLDTSSSAGRKVFIALTSSGKTMTNNMPASDALAASGSTLTEAQLLASIVNDYNSIQNSNLILATDADSDFATYGADHTIKIEEGSASGVSTGEAKVTHKSGSIVDCKISLTSKAYEDAKSYVSLVTHELGHCMGLDHPQETVWAIMSYFYNEDVTRLAIDDKMGIVHLYPKDSSYADEKPTLGLSCAAQ